MSALLGSGSKRERCAAAHMLRQLHSHSCVAVKQMRPAISNPPPPPPLSEALSHLPLAAVGRARRVRLLTRSVHTSHMDTRDCPDEAPFSAHRPSASTAPTPALQAQSYGTGRSSHSGSTAPAPAPPLIRMLAGAAAGPPAAPDASQRPASTTAGAGAGPAAAGPSPGWSRGWSGFPAAAGPGTGPAFRRPVTAASSSATGTDGAARAGLGGARRPAPASGPGQGSSGRDRPWSK